MGTVYGSSQLSEVACGLGVGFIAVPEPIMSCLDAWAVQGPGGIAWSDGA